MKEERLNVLPVTTDWRFRKRGEKKAQKSCVKPSRFGDWGPGGRDFKMGPQQRGGLPGSGENAHEIGETGRKAETSGEVLGQNLERGVVSFAKIRQKRKWEGLSRPIRKKKEDTRVGKKKQRQARGMIIGKWVGKWESRNYEKRVSTNAQDKRGPGGGGGETKRCSTPLFGGEKGLQQ